ncbi:MAG TPA: L,D-transpeptidase [Pseudolabrys sp.]|nr:L,D-transpeptidase [Pseudolabrys sp.]
MRSPISVGIAVLLLSNVASAESISSAFTETPPPMVVAETPRPQNNLGGGFIEFLFSDSSRQSRASSQDWYGPPQQADDRQNANAPRMFVNSSAVDPVQGEQRWDGRMDPQFLRQEVAFSGKETAGTVIIDTPNHFLYLVEGDGKAMRYGIGVGRPGFTWSGVHAISGKKEWPDWVPPDEMIKRQPYLPHFVAGGPGNPLGARALYLGSTLYRIHGSNEPWTIGKNVSSGCIRMRNADVIDLYERVKVGTKVVVL